LNLAIASITCKKVMSQEFPVRFRDIGQVYFAQSSSSRTVDGPHIWRSHRKG